jgi:hypothetical protein
MSVDGRYGFEARRTVWFWGSSGGMVLRLIGRYGFEARHSNATKEKQVTFLTSLGSKLNRTAYLSRCAGDWLCNSKIGYRRNNHAGPSDHAVEGVGRGWLGCWDCRFESRRGHGYFSVVNIACCSSRGLCDRPIPCSGESYRVCVIEWAGATITLYTYYNQYREEPALKKKKNYSLQRGNDMSGL